jgi:hypothetical protein
LHSDVGARKNSASVQRRQRLAGVLVSAEKHVGRNDGVVGKRGGIVSGDGRTDGEGESVSSTFHGGANKPTSAGDGAWLSGRRIAIEKRRSDSARSTDKEAQAPGFLSMLLDKHPSTDG